MGKQARLREQKRVLRQAVLAAYVNVASAVLPRYFRPDSCMNATRVCIDVLQMFGIEARPMVVDFAAFNKKWWELMMQTGGMPQSDADSEDWVAQGGWSLGIGGEETADGWPHHLIAMAGNTVIDSAASQASRPAHGIYFPWVVFFDVSNSWHKGGEPQHGEAPNGARCIYWAKPAEKSYENEPAFQPCAHASKVTLDIATGIQQRLNINTRRTA